jgi:hypothetical protein
MKHSYFEGKQEQLCKQLYSSAWKQKKIRHRKKRTCPSGLKNVLFIKPFKIKFNSCLDLESKSFMKKLSIKIAFVILFVLSHFSHFHPIFSLLRYVNIESIIMIFQSVQSFPNPFSFPAFNIHNKKKIEKNTKEFNHLTFLDLRRTNQNVYSLDYYYYMSYLSFMSYMKYEN